jgi:8-oxo-dGTP pyrophosphatase MutT (NUDIX family)
MKQLFTIDLKDYNPRWRKFYRPSVRGIIFDDDGKIAMIYSRKYHFYKFPGGGIEGNETQLETLAREIKEETGMTLILDSVKEFGEVLKIQSGDESGKNTIHVQQNFYYICKVKGEVGAQDLADDEKALDFVLKFIPVEEAIAVNSVFQSDDAFMKQMAERERRVLEIIKNGGTGWS